jgi:hypothetical protein
MPVRLAAMGVPGGITVAAGDSARRAAERLRAPGSWRKVAVRAVMRMHMHMTPVAMGSPMSAEAGHAEKATSAPTALAPPFRVESSNGSDFPNAMELLSSLGRCSPCAASASAVHPTAHPTRDFRRN